MKRFISARSGYYLLGVFLLLTLWFIASYVIDEQSLILPDPLVTIKETILMLGKEFTYKCMGSSLFKLVIGFAISLVLSLIFGIIAGNSKAFQAILSPFMSSMKSIPTAALVFLFLVIAGSSYTPIIMVVLISSPILYESIVGGIENMDQDVIKAMKLESTSRLRSVLFIEIPLMLPYLFVGIASSFSLSFKIEIMSEILTGDTRLGLGSAILGFQKTDPTNMIPIFAYSLIVIIISLIFNAIFNFVKKKYSI